MPASAPSRVAFANTLRGIAALCVVVQHYSHVFWNERVVTASLINAPVLETPPQAPEYLRWVGQMQPFELGQFGVGLFFLISGFVIPFSFTNVTGRGFAIGRLTRIYPTFWAGFTCTVIAVWMCGHYFGRAFPYDTAAVIAQYFPGVEDLTLKPGIDGIIWTLNIEMKFYLVCALMTALFARGSVWVFLAPLVMTGAAWLLWPVTQAIGGPTAARAWTIYLAIQFIDLMFVGVAFNYLARGWLSRRATMGLIAALCLAMTMIWYRVRPLELVLSWSYGTALAVFAAAYVFQRSAMFHPTRLTEFLADVSYPLYLVHGVIGYVLIRLLLDSGWPVTLALAAAFGGVVGLAALLHVAVEAPTQAWGRRLALRWGRRAP